MSSCIKISIGSFKYYTQQLCWFKKNKAKRYAKSILIQRILTNTDEYNICVCKNYLIYLLSNITKHNIVCS